MISTALHRRRAARFAAILDGSPDRSGPEQFGALLSVAESLQRMPINGDIDPAFRDRLRGRLMAVAAVAPDRPVPAQRTPATGELAAPTSHRSHGRSATGTRPGPVPRRIVVLGGVLISLLTTCGVVAASTTAAPGSPLYGVKQATESAQLALAGGDVAKGRLYLGFARTRADEARRVHGDKARLIGTLDAMDGATRRGARLLTSAAVTDQDRAPLDAVDRFLAGQWADVVVLLPGLDQQARAHAVQSIGLLDRLRDRADGLRTTLPCPGPDVTETDDLGPLPGACGHSNASRGSTSSADPRTSPGTAAGGASKAPGALASPGVGGLPVIPGTSLPTPSGIVPSGQPPPGSDVGSALTGVLGDVLGTIGVSPPPVPLLPGVLPTP